MENLDTSFWRLLAAGLAMGLGAIGPGIGIGLAGLGGTQAVSRNPDVAGTIFTYMLLAIAFAEAVAIYALVITLIILFVM